MFSQQMEYDEEMLNRLQRMNTFSSLFYVPLWMTASKGCDAPIHDLHFFSWYGWLQKYWQASSRSCSVEAWESSLVPDWRNCAICAVQQASSGNRQHKTRHRSKASGHTNSRTLSFGKACFSPSQKRQYFGGLCWTRVTDATWPLAWTGFQSQLTNGT